MNKQSTSTLSDILLLIIGLTLLYSSFTPGQISSYLEWFNLLEKDADHSVVMEHLKTIKFGSSVIAVSLSIFLSMRYYFHSSNKAFPILGLVAVYSYCTYIILTALFLYFTTAELIEENSGAKIYNENFHEGYEEYLIYEDKELEERVTLSNKIAAGYFKDTGKLLSVIDKNGEITTYAPNDEDRRKRHKYLMFMFDMRDLARNMLNTVITWAILILILTVGCLFFFKYSARRKTFADG